MNNTTATENKTTATEVNQPQTTTNEEILTLLRQLVGQGATANGQTAPKQNTQKPEAANDASLEEVKRLLEELLKAKAAPADVDVNDEEDATEEDNEFEGEIVWNPAPEWEPVAYAAGGAALVGLGALLYHLLKN